MSSFLFLSEYFLAKLIHFFLASLILNLSLIYFANFIFWIFSVDFTAWLCIRVKYLYLIFEFFLDNFSNKCFKIFFLFSCFFLYKYILQFFWSICALCFVAVFCDFSFHFCIVFCKILFRKIFWIFTALNNLLLKARFLILLKTFFNVCILFSFKELFNLMNFCSSLLFFNLSKAYLAPYFIVIILFKKLFNLILCESCFCFFIFCKILRQNFWIVDALRFKVKFLTLFNQRLNDEYNLFPLILFFFKIFFCKTFFINNLFLANFFALYNLNMFWSVVAESFSLLVNTAFFCCHFCKYFFNNNSLVLSSLVINTIFNFSFCVFFKVIFFRLLLNFWRLGLSNDFLILLNLAIVKIKFVIFFLLVS